MPARRQAGVPWEPLAVWTLYGFVASEVFATYARLPLRELYHVSGTGRIAGLGRVLVFLNWPTALVALAILPLVGGRHRVVAVVAGLLCAGIFWPGMVDQADLDAKWPNVVPATGVLFTLGLTLWAVRDGITPRAPVRGDAVRAIAAAVLVLVSLPWIAADLGLSIGAVPGLRSIFVTDEWWAPLGQARLHHAVHPGSHHGMVGTLLALAALVLSRCLARVRARRVRTPLALYLGVMLVYGIGLVANDASYEQLVKRGATSWSFPALIAPTPTLDWAVLLGLGLACGILLLRVADTRPPGAWRAPLVPLGVVAAAGAIALVVVGSLHGPQRSARTPFAHAGTGTIVFPMSTEGRFHLYSIRADGRGLTQLTDEDASDLAPHWSPDRMLAFQSNREDGEDVFVADPALAAVEQITDEDRDGEPAWAPDGKQIALVRNGDLYLVRPRSGRAHRVALDARWPTWAPGGSLIAYETDRDDRGRIVVVAPGVGGRAPLVVQGDNRAPAWSPRGDRIAYECRRGDHWHICLLEPDRGRRRLLTPGDNDEFAPAWSPDGRRIAFIGDRDGNDQLYVMRADGSEIVRLTSGQADKEAPAWRP